VPIERIERLKECKKSKNRKMIKKKNQRVEANSICSAVFKIKVRRHK